MWTTPKNYKVWKVSGLKDQSLDNGAVDMDVNGPISRTIEYGK